MNGIIFDIKRFAVHDGPGIRTTVFMKGCPLSCIWCHNPESLNPSPEISPKNVKIGDKVFIENESVGREISCEELMDEIRKEKIFMEESEGGITFSGGEPLFQHQFLRNMLMRCKKENIHTAVDTSGYASWKIIEGLLPFVDLFLYDIKMIDEADHKKYTGVNNKLILENLYKLSSEKKNIRMRIPIISGINDSENIFSIADFLDTLPNSVLGIDLLPFHNTASHKYIRFGMKNELASIKTPDKKDLKETKQYLESRGFRVKTGG